MGRRKHRNLFVEFIPRGIQLRITLEYSVPSFYVITMESQQSGGAAGPLGGRGHHFSRVPRGEVLTISCESETVEEAKNQPVSYIHTAGGTHAVLCVYGEKGTTLEKALQRDGRFRDDRCNFTLSDKETTETLFFLHYLLKGRPTFKVTFQKCGTYSISCDRPCTLLEALKSSQIYYKLKWSDGNLVIQLGAQCGEVTIATHFPCSCISYDVFLEISHDTEVVEVQDKSSTNTAIYSGGNYSVGRKYTKTKKLFKNNAVKCFKYQYVYWENWTTVEEALKRDGHFSDDLYKIILCCQKIRFECKICLPQNKTANDERPVLYTAYQRGIRAAVEISYNSGNIYELLHQNRFSNNSHQRAPGLRKKNFGKIQQPFSEWPLNLQKLGRSVCKVIVNNITGTGFVLFNNIILTNGHLFEGCVEAETLKKGVEVFALFNYDDPEPYTNYHRFKVVNSYIYFKKDGLDYAILELNTEGQRVYNPKTRTQKKIKIPPGLLKDVGPMPESGAACLIGHPGGEEKKMDLTCIIEKEKRGQAVYDHLHQYKDNPLYEDEIVRQLNQQGIENIMTGGKLADKRSTYKTFMYHGSSGSPVLNNKCQVSGLHTGGYGYEFPNTHIESVIEYAQPLCTILKHFVNMLKTKGDDNLLKRFKKAAKGNSEIQKVLESVSESQVVQAESEDFEMCSDSSEPMETDSEAP